MELDGQVRRGGVQFLGAAVPKVLPQDVGRDLVAIVDGQDVTVAQVQAGRAEGAVDECWVDFQGNTGFRAPPQAPGCEAG